MSAVLFGLGVAAFVAASNYLCYRIGRSSGYVEGWMNRAKQENVSRIRDANAWKTGN